METLYSIADFLLSVDPRVITASALVVALLALLRVVGKDSRDRTLKAKERAAFLAGFKELHFEPDPEGERRFVWTSPPGWDAPGADDKSRISEEDRFWIFVAIWSLPGCRPGLVKADIERDRGPYVYETNPQRSYKKRLLTRDGYHITVEQGTRNEPEPDKCIQHLRYLSGPNCPECGKPAAEVRKQNAELLPKLRAEWGAKRAGRTRAGR